MSEKDKQVHLLGQLIQFRSNDLLIDIEVDRISEREEYHLTELIMEITRYIHEIRYCSRSGCLCSPETGIKTHYEPIKDYLKRTQYALHPIPWKTIEEIIGEEE